MRESNHKITRFRKLRRRSFFMFVLLTAVAAFLLRDWIEDLSSFLVKHARLLGASMATVFNRLPLQGFIDKISLKLAASLNSSYLWSQVVYGSNIDQNWWLFSRWLSLAIMLGIFVPLVVLIIFNIINVINNYLKKTSLSNKFTAAIVKSIARKVNRLYRKSLLRNWQQASLIVLTMGLILFLFQLLFANLWWWSKGAALSSLSLFIIYAYWVYYDRLFGHNATRRSLLGRIDAHLQLKQGLLTVMETQNFNISPRFYKLILNEVIYKIKPANLSKVLPPRHPRFNRRNLLIPLLVIVCLSSLLSVVYSELVSRRFFSAIKEKTTYYLKLEDEPESIETVLQQEANSLRLLTDELRNSQTNQSGIVEDLDNLVIKLTYLAGTSLSTDGGALNVSGQLPANPPKPAGVNSQNKIDKPKADGWYKKVLKGFQKELQQEAGQSLDTAESMSEMPAGTSPDWPAGKPGGDKTVNIPLNPNAKQYQAASAELKKIAEQLLALKLDIDENLKEEGYEQLARKDELPGTYPAPDYRDKGLEDSKDEWLPADTGNLSDTKTDTNIFKDNDNSNTKRQPDKKGQYNSKQDKNYQSRRQDNKKKPTPLLALLQKIKNRLTNTSPKAGLQQDRPGQKLPAAQPDKPRSVATRAEEKPSKLSRKQPRKVKSRAPKKTQFQQLVKNLNKIGDQLTKIKLAEEGEAQAHKPRKNKEEPPPPAKHKASGAMLNKIKLDPIKTNEKTENPPDKPTTGIVRINNPHDVQIDPGLSPGAMRPAPLTSRPPMLKPQAGRRYLPASGGGHMQMISPPGYGRLEQKISTSAGRIRNLADQLLEVNNPRRIAFNTQKADFISSLFKDAKISANKPRGVDNRLPRVSERISKIDAPQEIEAITSELNQIAKEFQALGSDSGSKLARLRPDLKQLTESDFLGRRSATPLPQGGPDKADRQAVIIRGKRERSSKSSEDLERIRVEESPRHLPTHDISANVSAKLQQVGEKLQNVDVASIKANMSGVNIRDFMVEKQRTLEALDEQLPKAKDFQSVNQITRKIADLSAQLGKLTLDSMATADALANRQYIYGNQRSSQDIADRELRGQIKQAGKQLLELSRQMKQAGNDKSRIDTSSQILGLARGLGKTDFNQVMLNEHNKLQLSNQLRNVGRQLQQTGRQTTDLAGLKTNSYAISALADRLDKLGVGDIGFTASIENREQGQSLDLQQLVGQLSDLSSQMQAAAQSPTDYQDNAPRLELAPEPADELVEDLFTGARQLEQIKRKLELAGDQQDIREATGRELLKLSKMLKGTISEGRNDPLKNISTKAITSIGDQIKEMGRQLRSNPTEYPQISRRLQQLAGKLQERDQELSIARLASDQDVTKLASDLLQMARQLDKIAPKAITEQRKLAAEAENKLKAEKHRQLIDESSRDLMNMSQELAELAANYPDLPIKAGNYDNQMAKDVSEYTDRLGRMVNELMSGKTPRQLDRKAFESLGRELAELSQGLRATGLDRGDGSANTGELNVTAAESVELSPGLTEAEADRGAGRAFGDKLNKAANELLELSQGIRAAELGRGEDSAGPGNTDMNAASSIKDADRNALLGRLGEIKKLSERLGREPDPMQARDMLLEMAQRVKELADYPSIAEDLAYVSDAGGKELKQRLNQINNLDAKLRQQVDPKLAELMGENLLKLAYGLTTLNQAQQKPAVVDDYPDTGELALKLKQIQHEMKSLDLAQPAAGSASGEGAGMSREFASKLKQISNNISKLPYAKLEEIAPALDRLGGELANADQPEQGAARRRLNDGQMGFADKAGAGDSQQKTKVALKNIDQVLKRVKRLYKKANDRYNPDFSQNKLKLAVKGKARTNKGIIGKLKGSANTRGGFTAAKTGKDIDQTPRTEKIKNVYAMERNLSERDVFERIIKRLENKRERIKRFEAGAFKPVKPGGSART